LNRSSNLDNNTNKRSKLKRRIKLNSILTITIAVVVFIGGLCCMGLNITFANKKIKAIADANYLKNVSVPAAGVGKLVSRFASTNGESSIEMLSTTALGSNIKGNNEYYSNNGEIVGKLIVCKEKASVNVYDRIPGNERIEQGDSQMAQVIGQMDYGDTATLIDETGYWYKIVGDNFSGYTRKELYATGKEAEAMNGDTWDKVAIIGEDDLYLNSEPTYESGCMCMLQAGLSFTIVEEGDAFSKITVPGVGEGWVENALITKTEVRKVGKSIDEVYAKLASISDGVNKANGLYDQGGYTYSIIAPAPVDTEDIAAFRQAIADYAASYVGWLPYASGGNSLVDGADCCGFTQAIYAQFGIDIPRTCEGQLYGLTQVSLDDMRPGDIVCYEGHVGLYVGDGTIVHESVPGTVCGYQSAYMMPIYGVVRVIN